MTVDDGPDVARLVAWRYGLAPDATDLLTAMFDILRIGYPGSPTRGWIVRRGGAPVAKALVHRAGTTAGIYGVATRPEVRGHGLATILTLRCMRAALDEGVEHLVLHSPPAALALYRRLGFVTVAPFRLFAPVGALHV